MRCGAVWRDGVSSGVVAVVHFFGWALGDALGAMECEHEGLFPKMHEYIAVRTARTAPTGRGVVLFRTVGTVLLNSWMKRSPTRRNLKKQNDFGYDYPKYK